MHDYILDGTNIVKEIVTDICNCPKYVNEYLYDLDGTVCGIKHNGTAYYFYKNLQGDIIAITDDAGATVARYTYDAWGKVLSVTDASGTDISKTETHIANINPFRYRSYYYDADTELYYLQSRYYNPEVGRFINADSVDVVQYQKRCENLFVYCQNNPVYSMDKTGSLCMEDILTVITSVMGLIEDLAKQSIQSTSKFKGLNKCLKSLKKNGGDIRRIHELKKEMKHLTSKKAIFGGTTALIFSIISIVMTVLPYFKIILEYGESGVFTIMLVVTELFISMIDCAISKFLSYITSAIGGIGIVMGWAIGAVISLAISHFFTEERKEKIADSLTNEFQKNKNLIFSKLIESFVRNAIVAV